MFGWEKYEAFDILEGVSKLKDLGSEKEWWLEGKKGLTSVKKGEWRID